MTVSAETSHRVWGIHNDQPDVSPVEDGAVRIGWDETGDLSVLAATRDAFKYHLAVHMPEIEEKSIAGSAGVLYRFVHEMQVGDLVACPRRARRTIDIGRVSGPYEFHADAPVHRHWRPVEWLKTDVPRDELSQAAQNELRSLITLFNISTGREELEQIVSAPVVTDADFSWTTFYAQLADRVLEYATDRPSLLEKLWSVAERSTVPHLFKYLKGDHRLDGSYGPLRDIDPFTVFGSFNRGIREDARRKIASAFASEFGVAAPVPARFSGVPTANNLMSWFIHFENTRGDDEVDALWRLARAAVDYATRQDEATREALVTDFDDCATGQTRLLTMGLYWIRPATFTAFDSVNVTFIKQELPRLAEKLSLTSKLTGEQFLANTETLRAWLAAADAPYSAPCALSHAAFVYSVQSRLEEPVPDPVPVTSPAERDLGTIDQALEDSYDASSIRTDGCFLAEEELTPMLERLRARKNLVLEGPPGTGKTWLARRLAWALCDRRESPNVEIVQFHPSLAYEDFVRGWRPTGSGAGGGLTLEDGPFLRMCARAQADPQHPYVMVIEEINRGNPAQILGELLTLLEADKRHQAWAMRLAYPSDDEERFFIPPNLYVIGTMNVADRSLAMVDMALRRRFAFVQLQPRLGEDWREHVSQLGYDPQLLEAYRRRVEELNRVISTDPALGKQYGIGHSYFTPTETLDSSGLTTEQWWRRVVATDVRPLLEEYWFDRPSLADEHCTRLLGE